MTLVPPGAQLAPVDLPPPPPSADPREPSPSAIRTRHGARTPQRARSPVHAGSHSRGSSPTRPSGRAGNSDGHVPLAQPTPKAIGTSGSLNPIAAYQNVNHNTSPASVNPLHHSAPHLSRPSSPASIHSSSSAIFERDIEVAAVASLSLNPAQPTHGHTLNHKSSRLSHLSQAVPSVLDDAVEALTETEGTTRGLEALEIEGPAPSGGVGGLGMARQSSASIHGISGSRKVSMNQHIASGATLSRSSSPTSIGSGVSSGFISPAQSPPIHGQLSTQQSQHSLAQHHQPAAESTSSSPTNPSRPPMPGRISTGPQLPGGWAFGSTPANSGGAGAEELAGGRGIKEETEEAISPVTSNVGDEVIPSSSTQSPSLPAAIPSHLTPSKDKRRISFISYNDLLLSVPTTVTPLGDITSGTLSPEHLPGTVSPNVSTRSPLIPSSSQSGLGDAHPLGGQEESAGHGQWDTGAPRPGGLGLGDGEWGREGLGRGLEQRLEDLVKDETAR